LKVAPQLALSAQSITVDELEVSMFVNRVAVPSSCHAWTHIATRMHIHTHAHTHTHNTRHMLMPASDLHKKSTHSLP